MRHPLRLLPLLAGLTLASLPVRAQEEVQQSFPGRVDALATASGWIARSDFTYGPTRDNEGKIVLYQHQGQTWTEADELFAPTPAVTDNETFGTPLAMDGEWLATVSARPGGNLVFLFRLVDGSWTFFDELLPEDPQFWDLFNQIASIHLDGHRLALGMPRAGSLRDEDGNVLPVDEQLNIGGVVIYEFDGNDWNQTAFLERSGRQGGNGTCCGDRLGVQVHVNGDWVFAAAERLDNPIAFRFEEGAWVQKDAALPPEGRTSAVGISDADWWVQSSSFDCAGRPGGRCWSADLFQLQGDAWVWQQHLRNPVDEAQIILPGSLRDGRLLMGATEDPGDSENEGAIYEYALQDGIWELVDAIRADPPATSERMGGKVVQAPDFVATSASLKLYIFGAPAHVLSKSEVKCLTGVHKGFAKQSARRSKALRKCLKTRASKGGPVAQCMDAAAAKLDKGEEKVLAVEAKTCVAPPPFGSNGGEMANAAALHADRLLEDVLGSDLDGAIAEGTGRDPLTRCQLALARDAGKCQATWIKRFVSCAKKGLARGEIVNALGLDACRQDDPKGKIAKACAADQAKWTASLEKKCSEVDLLVAFPPCATAAPGELSQCLADAAACRVCLAIDEATGIGALCETCP